MRRAAFVAVLLLMAVGSAADAASDIRIERAIERVRQWLWPHRRTPVVPVPVSIPRPLPSPPANRDELVPQLPPAAIAPLPVVPEVVTPTPEVKAEPIVKPTDKAKPKVKQQGKAKLQSKAPARAADDGPDLPYSCLEVRTAAVIYSQEYLEAEGLRRGLTAKQKRQAQACFLKR